LIQARLVSEEWKKLSDDQKIKWEDKAKTDKIRYKKEMEGYTPPSDDDDADDDGAKKPKAKRAKKDPNAPKRPMNAYMLYANSIRASVREANPEMKMGDIVSDLCLL